jgi:hypothetical protein
MVPVQHPPQNEKIPATALPQFAFRTRGSGTSSGTRTEENGAAMASIDVNDSGYCDAAMRPRIDPLGRSLFVFHVLVGLYLTLGWLVPVTMALALYMVVLPVIAGQWLINKGSCVLNNFETWLRHGRWRDERNPEEGGWLAMLAHWLFRWKPSRKTLGALSYASVAALWLLAFGHLSILWGA